MRELFRAKINCRTALHNNSFSRESHHPDSILLGLRGKHRLRDPLYGGREDCGLQLAGATARHLD